MPRCELHSPPSIVCGIVFWVGLAVLCEGLGGPVPQARQYCAEVVILHVGGSAGFVLSPQGPRKRGLVGQHSHRAHTCITKQGSRLGTYKTPTGKRMGIRASLLFCRKVEIGNIISGKLSHLYGFLLVRMLCFEMVLSMFLERICLLLQCLSYKLGQYRDRCPLFWAESVACTNPGLQKSPCPHSTVQRVFVDST